MSRNSATTTDKSFPDGASEISVLKKVARLLEILVRLNLHTMRGDRTQKDMILMLDSVGCGPSEIADLLGTTPNSVSPILSRAKARTRRK